jgi:WD40 repeat protein
VFAASSVLAPAERRRPNASSVGLLSSAGAVREVRAHDSRAVAALAFDPDGRYLYGILHRNPRRDTASPYDSVVTRYDVSDVFSRPRPRRPPEWEVLGELPGTTGCLLAPVTDGRTVAVGSMNGSVGLWDTDTNRLVATLAHESDPAASMAGVEELAVSPDGSRLGVVSTGSAALWALPDRECVWRAQDSAERAVAFAPDGRTFATGDDDGVVWWRDYAGAPFREFRWELGAIRAVAFSPDGLTCAAAGLNGRVVVWDLDG